MISLCKNFMLFLYDIFNKTVFSWDLISFKGVCRLRGHKDAVTGIAFIQRVSSSVSSQALLVSVAKDTLIMVGESLLLFSVFYYHLVESIIFRKRFGICPHSTVCKQLLGTVARFGHWSLLIKAFPVILNLLFRTSGCS